MEINYTRTFQFSKLKKLIFLYSIIICVIFSQKVYFPPLPQSIFQIYAKEQLPSHAASTDSIYDMEILAPYLFTAGKDGFVIYNISNPRNTSFMGKYGEHYLKLAL